MFEWSFSSTAELVVGIALAIVVVALVFIKPANNIIHCSRP